MPLSIDERRRRQAEYMRRRRAENPGLDRAAYLAGGKEQQRRWREANRERVNHNLGEWAKRHPEKRKAIVQRWRDKSGEDLRQRERERSNAWRDANPDYSPAYTRDYRNKHPERIILHNARVSVARQFGLTSLRMLSAEMEALAEARALRIMVQREIASK